MNESSGPSGRASNVVNHRFPAWLFALLVLVAGLAVTAILWWNALRAAHDEVKADLQLQTSMIHHELERRIASYSMILRSVQGFYGARGKTRPQDARAFISSMGIKQFYPALHAVGIARIIRKNEIPSHVADMRRQGFPGYAVWPVGERETYAPIAIREPGPGSLGFDMLTNPERRAAMEKARDTGEMAVTGKTRLVRHPDNDTSAGIVVFLPIYRNGVTHDTVNERRNNIVGWVYAPFMMTRLMGALSKDHTNDLDIAVYDGIEMSEQSQLYHSGGHQFKAFPSDTYCETIHLVDAGGRTWMLAVHAKPDFIARNDQGKHRVIAISGIALSALLALLTWLLATGRDRALELAGRLTVDLKESEKHLRTILDSTPGMLWESNVEVTRLWVNKTCLDFFGVPDVGVFNERWLELIHPDDVVLHQETAEKAARTRREFQIEYRALRHDGQYRWLLVSGTPRLDKSGQYAGFIGVTMDITDRKNVEDELRLAAQVYQNSSEMMMVYDLYDGDVAATIIDVNPAFTSEMGYSRDEIIGRSARTIYDFQSSPGHYEAIRRDYMRDGHWQGEFVVCRKNGERMVTWLNLNAVPCSKGNATRHVALLRDIGQQKEAEETIRSLSASLISAREDEAKRIAREIHDDLGQNLSWLRINILMLPELLRKNPEKLDASIGRMRDSIDNSIHTVRNIASNLRPATLDMGFIMALEWLLDNFRVNTGLECGLDNRLGQAAVLDDVHSTGVFRILQEALTNVARHAQATRVDVELAQSNGTLHLKISDNGTGFETGIQRKPRSNGLAGMRERATMLGGHLDIDSAPGQGTRLHVSIPLPVTVGVRTNAEGNYC